MTIFTIGYSNKNINTFIEKLNENKITLVIDVRSKPYSRNPQFNRTYLEKELNKHSINYLFKGNNLGGLYENIDFEANINQVVQLSLSQRLVVMCTEGEPEKCHRYRTIAPALEIRGKIVTHLLWN
jgi:uncharacterized protein (DUF488 family)